MLDIETQSEVVLNRRILRVAAIKVLISEFLLPYGDLWFAKIISFSKRSDADFIRVFFVQGRDCGRDYHAVSIADCLNQLAKDLLRQVGDALI